MIHLSPTPTLFPYTTLFRSAPQKVPVVFSRTDKTKPWPTFVLKAEIPTVYQPVSVTLAQDSFDNVPLTLKPITELDRKSTRLNSSHMSISYAVFCLKKKNVV